jgi:Caudovirus prohead serine protease
MSEHKALTGVEIKDADQGLVTAVFATLNVKDLDGDVTTPGAFEEGASVRISSFGHGSWSGSLPVGKGVIREDGEKALLDGQFFLNTATGRDHFETVKEMGGLMEWSYGYDVVEGGPGKHQGEDVNFLRKLKVHEVSPVLLGAGIDTTTLAVKASERKPFPDEFERVLGDVKELFDRVEGWGRDTDGKEGRVLSTTNRDRLEQLASAHDELGAAIRALLAETDPNKHRVEAQRQLVRYLAMGAGL